MPTSSNVNYDPGLARDVLRIRLGQLIVNECIRNKAFRIPVHLALGHEAIAAAVSKAMGPNDQLCVTHRNIHYNIARAHSLKTELAELKLREDGVAKGRFGSMNMVNPERGIIYASSILGNNLPVAAGVALAEQVDPRDGVVFIVTGDGAMEEGTFYESIEFMKGAGLKVIVLVENNGWSMFTRISERRCEINVGAFAGSFGVRYETLTGNNPWSYADRLLQLRHEVVKTSSPAVVEVGLSTLGDTSAPDGRQINYHHGLAIAALSDWPVLRADESDPVHVIAESLGEKATRDIAGELHSALMKEAHDDLH